MFGSMFGFISCVESMQAFKRRRCMWKMWKINFRLEETYNVIMSSLSWQSAVQLWQNVQASTCIARVDDYSARSFDVSHA